MMGCSNFGHVAVLLALAAATHAADSSRQLRDSGSTLCSWTGKAPASCTLSITAVSKAGAFTELDKYGKAFYGCFNPYNPMAPCTSNGPATPTPPQAPPRVPGQTQGSLVNSAMPLAAIVLFCVEASGADQLLQQVWTPGTPNSSCAHLA
jgi:hypothetical protein